MRGRRLDFFFPLFCSWLFLLIPFVTRHIGDYNFRGVFFFFSSFFPVLTALEMGSSGAGGGPFLDIGMIELGRERLRVDDSAYAY